MDALKQVGEMLAQVEALPPGVVMPPEMVGHVLKLFRLTHTAAEWCAREAKVAREARDRYVDALRVACGPRGSDESPGHVYFIQSDDADALIKIGFSRHPRGRMRTLQAQGGRPLVLLHYERGTKQDESALHRRFASARIRGEWFTPTPNILDYVKNRKSVKRREQSTQLRLVANENGSKKAV